MIASSPDLVLAFFLDSTTPATSTSIPSLVFQDEQFFATTLVPGFLEPETPIAPEFVPEQVPIKSTTSLKPSNDLIDFTLQPETTTFVDNFLHELAEINAVQDDDSGSLHEHDQSEDVKTTTQTGAMISLSGTAFCEYVS